MYTSFSPFSLFLLRVLIGLEDYFNFEFKTHQSICPTLIFSEVIGLVACSSPVFFSFSLSCCYYFLQLTCFFFLLLLLAVFLQLTCFFLLILAAPCLTPRRHFPHPGKNIRLPTEKTPFHRQQQELSHPFVTTVSSVRRYTSCKTSCHLVNIVETIIVVISQICKWRHCCKEKLQITTTRGVILVWSTRSLWESKTEVFMENLF